MDHPVVQRTLELARQLAAVPEQLQWALAAVGALYLGSKLLGYLSLVLSAFVFVGHPVRAASRLMRLPCAPPRLTAACSSASTAAPGRGPS